MNQHPDVTPIERQFDLTSAATLADEYTRFQRLQSAAMAIFLMAFGVFGLVLLAVVRKTSLISWAAPLVVVGIGFGLAALTWRYRPRRGPRSLLVDSEGLTLGSIPNSRPIRVRWDDTQLRMEILDFRTQPEVAATGRRRASNFALKVRRAPFAQLPDAAYDLILEQAHSRGLEVARRKMGLAGSPVPILRLTIRAKPHGTPSPKPSRL